jgi:hypothetical protein
LFKPIHEPLYKSPELQFLQESIDNALLAQLHAKRRLSNEIEESGGPPQIKSGYSDFPSPLDRVFDNFEVTV